MQLHELQPQTARQTRRRVGRGGKRGKTSGRGHKGQKARAGNSTRPHIREMIKKLPKLRGHGKNRAQTVNAERVLPIIVNVSVLEELFAEGAEVNPKTLVARGAIQAKSKRVPMVKILGTGELHKKFKVSACVVSKTAREKIEKVGGTIA